MKPGVYNFTICRHVSFGPRTFVLNSREDGVLTPIDLTGLTPRWQARERTTGEVKMDLEPVLGDADAGEVVLEFTLEQAAAFPVGTWHHDLVFEREDGGRVGPYLKGTVTITELNTQPD